MNLLARCPQLDPQSPDVGIDRPRPFVAPVVPYMGEKVGTTKRPIRVGHEELQERQLAPREIDGQTGVSLATSAPQSARDQDR